MLMLRQKHFIENDGKGFTLLQQEEFKEQKNIPWDELVRRNSEKLAKQIAKMQV